MKFMAIMYIHIPMSQHTYWYCQNLFKVDPLSDHRKFQHYLATNEELQTKWQASFSLYETHVCRKCKSVKSQALVCQPTVLSHTYTTNMKK